MTKEIIIEEFYNAHDAEVGVNETLEEFKRDSIHVSDIQSHVVIDQDSLLYIFIYKIKEESTNDV